MSFGSMFIDWNKAAFYYINNTCDNYITPSIQKYAVLSHFRGKKSAYFLLQMAGGDYNF